MRTTRVAFSTALVAVAGLLGACGGHGSSSPTPPPASGQATATTTAPLAGAGRPPVIVGDKNTTEQFLLGELYAKALAAQGYSVELNQNIGPPEVTLQALSSKLLDMYPEYLDTWNSSIAGIHHGFASWKAAYRAGAHFARRHGLRLLEPTSFSDQDGVVVTDAFASARRLRSLADLPRVAADIVFGGAPQFQSDPRGLPALEQAYGFYAVSYVPVALGEQYDALSSGTAQAVQGSTTDGALATGGFRMLSDPKKVFRFGQAVPVVSLATLREEGPAFARTVDAVSRMLTLTVMRQLNAAVDIYHQDPASVAEQYLQANGLVPAPPPR